MYAWQANLAKAILCSVFFGWDKPFSVWDFDLVWFLWWDFDVARIKYIILIQISENGIPIPGILKLRRDRILGGKGASIIQDSFFCCLGGVASPHGPRHHSGWRKAPPDVMA